MQLFLHFTLN